MKENADEWQFGIGHPSEVCEQKELSNLWNASLAEPGQMQRGPCKSKYVVC